MNHPAENWVPLRDVPQKWWKIGYSYDGKPGCLAASIGENPDEAKENFLQSVAEPRLVIIRDISLIGQRDALQVLEELWG